MINPLAQRNAAPHLVELHKGIDWMMLELILSSGRYRPQREKAWPQLILFKLLLLGCWDNLEIPLPSKRHKKYFPLHRFTGLSKFDPMPDNYTLQGFRSRLKAEGLLHASLEELNKQICSKGLSIGPAKDI